MQQQQADEQAAAQKRAMRQQQAENLNNENALVEQGFRKRQQARGIGESLGSTPPTQSGAVLSSMTASAKSLI
jgi:hypothetical protein